MKLSNYKLPLKKVKKGHGYLGTVAFSDDGSKIQCHVCGGMFPQLAFHLKEHKLTADAYRAKFDLAKGTSLISETIRAAFVENGIRRWNSMTPKEKEAFKESKPNTQGFKGNTLETKNKRGHCPDQLLQKITDLKDALGRTPSLREFRKEMNLKKNGGVVAMVFATFGSWNNALKLAKLKINAPTPQRYDDKILLESLSVFYKVHKKIPTKSDAARGLIPDINAYRKHFGGIVRARTLAGLPYFHPQRRVTLV